MYISFTILGGVPASWPELGRLWRPEPELSYWRLGVRDSQEGVYRLVAGLGVQGLPAQLTIWPQLDLGRVHVRGWLIGRNAGNGTSWRLTQERTLCFPYLNPEIRILVLLCLCCVRKIEHYYNAGVLVTLIVCKQGLGLQMLLWWQPEMSRRQLWSERVRTLWHYD